jgi:heptaprenyl diphosphate synthase
MRQPGDACPVSEKILAVLGAFCLFLSTVEYMIPKPLPFLRLGLANFPLILALKLDKKDFWSLVVIKVLAQALISGTLFSYIFLFSISGTAASAALMFALYHLLDGAPGETGKKRLIGFTGISVSGAFISNITQIILARFFILGEGALYIAPPFLALGTASGFLLGLFAQKFAKESEWYNQAMAPRAFFIRPSLRNGRFLRGKALAETAQGGCEQASSQTEALAERARGRKWRLYFVGGILFSLALLFSPSPFIRLALFIFFWIVAAAEKRAGNPLVTALVFLGLVLFNISVPYGKVLFSIWSFPVTEGALLGALKKAATVEGLLMISKVAIRKDFSFPGRTGWILGESFRILHILREKKIKIRPESFIKDIDAILLEAEYL